MLKFGLWCVCVTCFFLRKEVSMTNHWIFEYMKSTYVILSEFWMASNRSRVDKH